MIENQLEANKKSIFLGYSKKYTLYDSGCLVHALARLLKLPVLPVHERLKIFGCFFADATGDVCLLDLSKVPNAYPQLKYIGKESSWNQDKALAAIKQAGGLIVEVDSNSIMNGTQQHFVYFRGNGEMEDSLGGVVRPTTYYKNIISMRIFDVLPLPEPTVSDDQKIFDKIVAFWHSDARVSGGNLEGTVNALIGWAGDMPKLEERILTLEMELKKSQEKSGELSQKLALEQKNGTEWQRQLATATESLGKITEERDNCISDKVSSDNRYKNKNDEFNGMKLMVSDYNTIFAFLMLKLRKESLDDYLKIKLPEVIKIINSK